MYIYVRYIHKDVKIHTRERTGSTDLIPRFYQLLCILTPDFHVQFPYPGWQSRQRIQIGPKQSLLPNSTETPAPTCGWEALPRTVPRGASSQGPGHWVMGRWDLSGDDRAWGKALGECACTGVTQDTPESDTISESREGHFRKDRLNMTLPEKEPCLTPFFSSSLTSGLPQAKRVFRSLSWKLKTCCLMLRVNTSPSWAPTTHTQGSPHHEEQTGPCGHCLRRASGQSTSAERPTWDFPTLSLGSHSPPGEASCTQQQQAPLLTRQSPSGHTAGPNPSPLRTEYPLLSPDLSPQDWEGSRLLMLSEGSRLESTGPS